VEPQQRLANRPYPLELVEDQTDRLLHAPVRVFLQPMVLSLLEPNGCDNDQLTAFGHRASGFQ
jgi:hypothetical protein